MRSSVVVVSYRPGRWLESALASAVAQADEVVLVDNGSRDGLASDIGSQEGVDVLRLGRNRGFPAGVNCGMERASGDLLAILNDDAIADPHWLERSATVLSNPGVAAVAPKLLLAKNFAEVRFPDQPWYQPPDPRRLGRMIHSVTVRGEEVLDGLLGGVHRTEEGMLDGVARRWRWTSGDALYVPLEADSDAGSIVVDGAPVAPARVVRLINNAGSYLSQEGHAGDRGWETPDDGQFEDARECFGVCGAAAAFTRATWERVGPFASRFFAYYEDVDWSWRARLGGQSIFYEPSAVVSHVRSATSGGEADAGVRLLAGRNRMHTLARNAPIDVVARQLRQLGNPDLPSELAPAARRRAVVGLGERLQLRRRWRHRPAEVWERWAGQDERWEDPGSLGPRLHLPPRVQFGD